jgi:hypothetical protein
VNAVTNAVTSARSKMPLSSRSAIGSWLLKPSTKATMSLEVEDAERLGEVGGVAAAGDEGEVVGVDVAVVVEVALAVGGAGADVAGEDGDVGGVDDAVEVEVAQLGLEDGEDDVAVGLVDDEVAVHVGREVHVDGLLEVGPVAVVVLDVLDVGAVDGAVPADRGVARGGQAAGDVGDGVAVVVGAVGEGGAEEVAAERVVDER